MSAHARLLLGSALFLVLLILVALTASASLYHFYDGVSDPPPTFPSTGKAVAISNAQWAAQSFQASASYFLTRVSLWAQYSSNVSEASMVEVRSDAGGLPNMAVPPLGSNTQFGSAAYGWVNFTPSLPIQLVAGQMYWVVMRNASGVSSIGWNWWNTRADTYLTPGQGFSSANEGGTWSAGGIGDFTLRTFGYEETTVSLSIAPDTTEVARGGSARFTVWFNNTGTEIAQQVWINITLPSGFAFESDNASSIGGLRTPGTTDWTFWNVARGSHFYRAIASINGGVVAGAFLVVGVSLDYTDFLGLPRAGSTASLSILVTAGAPPGSAGVDLSAWLAVGGVLAALAVAFVIWRGGRIDEIFLVHWSGVLIVHLSKTIKSATDRDILAAMLTTIQQFAREAFVEWQGHDIRRIDLGGQKVFLRRGSYTYLAAVVRGRKPGSLASRMARSVVEFEGIFEPKLEEWDGALETLVGAEEMLADAMLHGGFVRFSRWVIRRLRPRGDRPPASLASILQDRRRARASKHADLRKLAVRLKQRPELAEMDENYRSMVATALEEVSEGRFTVCGFANIYLATAHLDPSSPKNDAWWGTVLQMTRDVLHLWKWDGESQAWVSEHYEASHSRRSEADARASGAPNAPHARETLLPSRVRALDMLPLTKDG
ncbi:MAG TPA: choice-of-anchor R domain-containing protein [Thermoplasmata archaeon]|nr:choice-of-anchor R domain-containing protein [Thermoplasmata archaeon]